MTRSAIYTGFVQLRSTFLSDLDWISYSLRAHALYANRIGAAFVKIDDSNPRIQQCKKNMKQVALAPGASIKNREAMLGFYTSIIAVMEFVESDYDQFYWLDLDLAFNHFDYDIFSDWQPGFGVQSRVERDMKPLPLSVQHKNIAHRVLSEHFPFVTARRDRVYCGGHVFSLDKKAARALLLAIEPLGLMRSDIWPLVDAVGQAGGNLADEPILEFALTYFPDNINLRRLDLSQLPGRIVEPFHGYIPAEGGELSGLERLLGQDYFMFHFRGFKDRKNQIPNYYTSLSKLASENWLQNGMPLGLHGALDGPTNTNGDERQIHCLVS